MSIAKVFLGVLLVVCLKGIYKFDHDLQKEFESSTATLGVGSLSYGAFYDKIISDGKSSSESVAMQSPFGESPIAESPFEQTVAESFAETQEEARSFTPLPKDFTKRHRHPSRRNRHVEEFLGRVDYEAIKDSRHGHHGSGHATNHSASYGTKGKHHDFTRPKPDVHPEQSETPEEPQSPEKVRPQGRSFTRKTTTTTTPSAREKTSTRGDTKSAIRPTEDIDPKDIAAKTNANTDDKTYVNNDKALNPLLKFLQNVRDKLFNIGSAASDTSSSDTTSSLSNRTSDATRVGDTTVSSRVEHLVFWKRLCIFFAMVLAGAIVLLHANESEEESPFLFGARYPLDSLEPVYSPCSRSTRSNASGRSNQSVKSTSNTSDGRSASWSEDDPHSAGLPNTSAMQNVNGFRSILKGNRSGSKRSISKENSIQLEEKLESIKLDSSKSSSSGVNLRHSTLNGSTSTVESESPNDATNRKRNSEERDAETSGKAQRLEELNEHGLPKKWYLFFDEAVIDGDCSDNTQDLVDNSGTSPGKSSTSCDPSRNSSSRSKKRSKELLQPNNKEQTTIGVPHKEQTCDSPLERRKNRRKELLERANRMADRDANQSTPRKSDSKRESDSRRERESNSNKKAGGDNKTDDSTTNKTGDITKKRRERLDRLRSKAKESLQKEATMKKEPIGYRTPAASGTAAPPRNSTAPGTPAGVMNSVGGFLTKIIPLDYASEKVKDPTRKKRRHKSRNGDLKSSSSAASSSSGWSSCKSRKSSQKRKGKKKEIDEQTLGTDRPSPVFRLEGDVTLADEIASMESSNRRVEDFSLYTFDDSVGEGGFEGGSLEEQSISPIREEGQTVSPVTRHTPVEILHTRLQIHSLIEERSPIENASGVQVTPLQPKLQPKSDFKSELETPVRIKGAQEQPALQTPVKRNSENKTPSKSLMGTPMGNVLGIPIGKVPNEQRHLTNDLFESSPDKMRILQSPFESPLKYAFESPWKTSPIKQSHSKKSTRSKGTLNRSVSHMSSENQLRSTKASKNLANDSFMERFEKDLIDLDRDRRSESPCSVGTRMLSHVIPSKSVSEMLFASENYLNDHPDVPEDSSCNKSPSKRDEYQHQRDRYDNGHSKDCKEVTSGFSRENSGFSKDCNSNSKENSDAKMNVYRQQGMPKGGEVCQSSFSNGNMPPSSLQAESNSQSSFSNGNMPPSSLQVESNSTFQDSVILVESTRPLRLKESMRLQQVQVSMPIQVEESMPVRVEESMPVRVEDSIPMKEISAEESKTDEIRSDESTFAERNPATFKLLSAGIVKQERERPNGGDNFIDPHTPRFASQPSQSPRFPVYSIDDQIALLSKMEREQSGKGGQRCSIPDSIDYLSPSTLQKVLVNASSLDDSKMKLALIAEQAKGHENPQRGTCENSEKAQRENSKDSVNTVEAQDFLRGIMSPS